MSGAVEQTKSAYTSRLGGGYSRIYYAEIGVRPARGIETT